jgi:hypothetical protein
VLLQGIHAFVGALPLFFYALPLILGLFGALTLKGSELLDELGVPLSGLELIAEHFHLVKR